MVLLDAAFLAAWAVWHLALAGMEVASGELTPRGRLREHFATVRGEEVRRPSLEAFSRWFAEIQRLAGPGQSRRQAAVLASMSVSAGVAFALLFGSPLATLLGAAAGLLYARHVLGVLRERWRQVFAEQFRDALESMAASLRAGATFPAALGRCVSDLERGLRHQVQQPVLVELRQVTRALEMGIPLDEALEHFRDRVGTEDADDFVAAAVFTRAKGGNLAEVMTSLASVIRDRIAVRREVAALTAGKRAEARLLTGIPIGLALLLLLASPSYMEPFWADAGGRLLMLLAAGMLAAAFWISRRIVDIEV